MNTPPLLLATAVLFWGWLTGFLVLAASAAAALELPRVVSFRIEVSERALVVLARLTAAAFGVIAAYIFATERSLLPFLRGWGMQSAPLILLPLALAQAWGAQRTIDPGAVIPALAGRIRPFNLAYLYLALVLLSTGLSKAGSPIFLAGLTVIMGWALFPFRPKRSNLIIAGAMLAAAGTAGYFGGLGLQYLQRDLIMAMVRFYTPELNIQRNATSIGEIGELKASGEIVMRARPLGTRPLSLTLFRAAFNIYKNGAWIAAKAPLAPVQHENGRWILAKGEPGPGGLEVVAGSGKVSGALPVTRDTLAIEGLRVNKVFVSRLGSATAQHASGSIRYRTVVGAGRSFAGQPDDLDLEVSQKEQAALDAVIGEADAAGLPPRETVGRLQRLFGEKFVYSLDLASGRQNATPLADFLLRTRAGHCEYFATAGTLLLRRAGVPARYIVGYVTDEFSDLEGAFRVRARDSHAWVAAWVDGAWTIFDPTPSSWMQQDRGEASVFEPLFDFWSWLMNALDELSERPGAVRKALFGVLAVIALVSGLIAWRFRSRFRRAAGDGGNSGTAPARAGADSPFYRVEKELALHGLGREQHETHGEWLGRIRRESGSGIAQGLEPALKLHAKLRFDPEGITGQEARTLEQEVETWLRETREGLRSTSHP